MLSSSRLRSSHIIKKDFFTLKMKGLQSFEISRRTHPLAQYHISEDFSNIAVRTLNVTFSLLSEIWQYHAHTHTHTHTHKTTTTINNGKRIPLEKTKLLKRTTNCCKISVRKCKSDSNLPIEMVRSIRVSQCVKYAQQPKKQN